MAVVWEDLDGILLEVGCGHRLHLPRPSSGEEKSLVVMSQKVHHTLDLRRFSVDEAERHHPSEQLVIQQLCGTNCHAPAHLLTCGSNPMSSMRSASSSTRYLHKFRLVTGGLFSARMSFSRPTKESMWEMGDIGKTHRRHDRRVARILIQRTRWQQQSKQLAVTATEKSQHNQTAIKRDRVAVTW